MEEKQHEKRKLKRKFKSDDRNKYKYVPGSQQEGQGFANKMKEKVFHDYKRLKRKEGTSSFDVQKIYKDLQESDDEPSQARQKKPIKKFDQRKKISGFSKAQWEYQKKAEEKQRRAEERMRKMKEKEEALAKYKEKKKHRFLKLCKRTSKGQPVLSSQIELMLEKLQRQREAENLPSASSS